jgi:hypothetical protein
VQNLEVELPSASAGHFAPTGEQVLDIVPEPHSAGLATTQFFDQSDQLPTTTAGFLSTVTQELASEFHDLPSGQTQL